MQLALRQHWREAAVADWTAWNQALAIIWLVGTPAVRAGARRMDRLFGLYGYIASMSMPFFDRSGSVHAARSKQQGRRLPDRSFEMQTSTRRSRV